MQTHQQQNIEWQNIDTVLLDMDGTLLDLHYDHYFWMTHLPKRYAEIHQVDYDSAKEELHEHIKSIEGSLNWYCLDYWSEVTQLDVPALKKEVQDLIQLRPQVAEFLDYLNAIGKKRVLITNSHPKGIEIKMACTQIDRSLDLIISSHEFKRPKEDLLFWQELQAREGFDPERSLFIDDTPRILASAKAFGIKYLVCINQPNSQLEPIKSNQFIDICHFDEIINPN